MMNKKIISLSLSAALGGLVLGVMTPAAHGHGNNPKRGDIKPRGNPTSSTRENRGTLMMPELPESDTPYDTWDAQKLPPSGARGLDDPPGGIGIFIDPMRFDPVDVEMPTRPDLDPTAGPITFVPGIDSVTEGVFGDVRTRVGGIGVPNNGVIPAPGTLALLGLAALVCHRRRRRG